MSNLTSTEQVVRIEVSRHSSGILLGTSPDLSGFTHTAPSAEQFEAEIDWAVKDMLEATGRFGGKIERMHWISPA